MRTFTFSISCPAGPEHHEKLKRAFPNLSAKVMNYLYSELLIQEKTIKDKEARDKWLFITPYPAIKKLIGNRDPFDYETDKVVEMLKTLEITVTEKEAAHLINKLQNEWLDKNGGGLK